MGQNTSKQHSPLTFGYINRIDNNNKLPNPIPESDQQVTDYILAHPHLYKLEITCQNGCSSQHTRSNSNDISMETDSVVVATKINEECEVCRQNKRLSLVRRDLAKDLAYIDETYYPDVIHYVTNAEEDDENDMDSDSMLASPDGGDNLDKLTIGQVAPDRSRSVRRANTTIAVNLSNRALIKLSPSIGYLNNLTKLDLSHNQMTTLPRTIGYLKNLRILDISYNRLVSLPDTIAFLTKLTSFNVSYNNLEALPISIGLLPNLIVVIANNNQLTHVPREIAQLRGLVSLNVSNNPLHSLPVEIGNLTSLRKLVANGCEFLSEFSYPVDQQYGPLSLFEISARAVVRHEIPIPGHMADHIKEYFGRVQTCSFCGGPFFDTFITRGRFIERSARQVIALEYKLCSAHWSSEQDRLQALFAPIPLTAVLPLRCRKPNVNTDGLIDNPNPQQHNNIHALSPQPRRILSNHNRSRAYSDLSTRSYAASPAMSLSSSASSQLSKRSNSSFSLSLYTSSSSLPQSETDLVSIQSLKWQPVLPALPVPASSTGAAGLSHTISNINSSIPSSPSSQPKRRPRASSSSSVTRRLTGLLSSSRSRSFSSSNLRRQQSWTQTAAADSRRSGRLEDLSEVETDRTVSSSWGVYEESTSTTKVLRQPQPTIIFTSDEDGAVEGSGDSSSSSPASVTPPMIRTATSKIPTTNGLRASLVHIGARFSKRDRSGTV